MFVIYGLVLLAGLIWVPLLFRGIERKGFVLLLVWLLVAPIAVNVVTRPGTNPFFNALVRKTDGVGTGGYFREGGIKFMELVQPTRVLLIAFVIVFLMNALMRKRRLGRFDSTEKFAGIFSLLLLANVFWQSERVAFGIRVAIDAFIIPFIAYFCARRLVTSEDQLRQFMKIVGCVGIYLIIIGLIDRATMPGTFLRVQGPFEDRNEMYIILVVVFFMSLLDFMHSTVLRNEAEVLPRIAQLFLLCFSPLIILLAWSRGNLLGFLLAVWTFLFLGRKMVGLRPKIAVAGLLLLLTPILALAVVEFTPREIVDSRVVRSQTVYSRLGAWQRMLEEGFESPIFGIGLNNLRNVLAEDRINFEGVYSEDNPHNSLLSIFAEMGFVGLLAYLLILMSLIRIGTGLYRKGSNSRERWRGITVISILVGYWIPAFFVNAIYIPAVCHLYVYVYFGAIAGLHGKRRVLSPMSASTANNRWAPANAPAVGASRS
jgi:hypothetical protein